MTTNHKEKLDPALLRPGRSDFHVCLNNASYAQMTNMFKRFNPGCEEEKADEFAKQLPEFKISMAKLQGHLMKYRGFPDQQIEHVLEILEEGTDLADMTVTEYLKRLNLSQYAPKFSEKKMYFLSDLRFYNNEGALETEFGIKDVIL